SIDNPEIAFLTGNIQFTSRTVRAFKIPMLEDCCEDYGQVAYYQGAIPGYPHAFDLDNHHRFVTGKPVLVCGNTAAILSETRFAKAFKVIGDRFTHFGTFNCSGGSGGGGCSSSAGSSGGGSCTVSSSGPSDGTSSGSPLAGMYTDDGEHCGKCC
ncbi:MAG: hypothetical protein LBH87_00340, partial [Coriobacteriales bacterium]|nr:hypothetical protein [Coriobacteriales bacterium]